MNMGSSAMRAFAFVLLLQSTCWIGVWARLHDIIVEGSDVHWDYSNGPYGPANWHNLNPGYAACAGTMQSPIAVDATDMLTDPLTRQVYPQYNLNNLPATITKRDHDIEVEMPEGFGYLYLDGDPDCYKVSSFHYHMPSEHRILNQSFPLELHVVHWKYNRNTGTKMFAVVSYLFVEGHESVFLNQLRPAQLPYISPNYAYPLGTVYLMLLGNNYGRYFGSLTTPPCTEGVKWIVNLWNFPTASKLQLQQLQNALPTPTHTNSRPAFPSAGRYFRTSF